MSAQLPKNQRKWREYGCATQQRCFCCNEIGHLARLCPQNIHWCSFCHEWSRSSAICDAARQRRHAMKEVAIGNQCHLASRDSNDFPIGNGHIHPIRVSSQSLNSKGVPYSRAGLKVTPAFFLNGSALSGSIPSQPIIQCVLGGVCVNALLDTGSNKSLLIRIPLIAFNHHLACNSVSNPALLVNPFKLYQSTLAY